MEEGEFLWQRSQDELLVGAPHLPKAGHLTGALALGFLCGLALDYAIPLWEPQTGRWGTSCTPIFRGPN